MQDVGESGKKLDNTASNSSSPTMSVSKVQLQKRSLSSQHLIAPADSPVEAKSQLIVVKPEVNCGGSVMSVSRAGSAFTYDDGQCKGSMRQNVDDVAVKSDLSGADSPSNLFSCNWIDGSRSSAGLETVTIKPEPSVDGIGELRQYEDFAAHGLELPTYVGSRNQYLGHSGSFESQNCMNDVCLGNVSSGQQFAGSMVNNVDMMASDVSMDSMRQQQMIVDENVGDYGFSPHHSSLISSQSMPLLPTYTASEVIKGPTAAGYRMAGMFTDKCHSFVDPSFSYSGSMPMAYNGGVQHDILAKEPESGYGRSFGYSDHDVMHFQNSDQRTNQTDAYCSSVPRTPTLYAAVGPKQLSQQTGNRTPRTPYTPGTPGRASRFQYPSITEGAVVGNCQHRYQKSTAYHPYGHQHTPSQVPQMTQLGPASPHYLNQRHVASVAHEVDQQQFRHDVAHAQQEIEQRLQQLQHEDKMKQMLMTDIDTSLFPGAGDYGQPTCTADSNAMSPDASVRNAAVFHTSHNEQALSPVDEVLQLIMRDAPEISADTGNVVPIAPTTNALQLKSESIREAPCPHSASDSLLSQITFSSLADDQMELKKLRRKHKPEPLVIPPDVSNFGTSSAAVQWSGAVSDRCRTQLSSDTSAVLMSPGMGVGCGTHWVQRPQQISRDGEPRSAPPFHWSSAVMCKLTVTC